jgi:hypothetical protein
MINSHRSDATQMATWNGVAYIEKPRGDRERHQNGERQESDELTEIIDGTGKRQGQNGFQDLVVEIEHHARGHEKRDQEHGKQP